MTEGAAPGEPIDDEDQDAPIDAPETLAAEDIGADDDNEDDVDEDEAFANDEIPDDA
jgi:hypothetical protein